MNFENKKHRAVRKKGSPPCHGGPPSARLLVNPHFGRRPDRWARKAVMIIYVLNNKRSFFKSDIRGIGRLQEIELSKRRPPKVKMAQSVLVHFKPLGESKGGDWGYRAGETTRSPAV